MSKELAIIAQTDAVGNFVQSFRHKKAEVLSISMGEVSICHILLLGFLKQFCGRWPGWHCESMKQP